MTTDSRAGGPGLLGAFVPWIVYWVLVGNVDVGLASGIPFLIAGVQILRTLQSGVTPKVLEIGSLVVFALLTLVALLGDDAFLDRWMQPLANGALFLVALASVIVGKPFALQYAREEAPPEVQDSPLFVRTSEIITWVWIGAFAVMAFSSAIPPLLDGAATMRDQDDALSVVFYWIVPFVTLAGALLFTKWYPDEVRRRATTAPA